MSLDQAPRVRGAVFGRESRAIDIVTPVAGQFDAVFGFGVFGSGFGVLAREAAHTDHRSAGAVHHDQRHLQQHLELAGDGVRRAFVERFRTVPALQEEPLPAGGFRQLGLEGFDFPTGDQRRQSAKSTYRRLELLLIWVGRLLKGREFSPV